MSCKAWVWCPAFKYGSTVFLKEIVDILRNWTMFRAASRCVWIIDGIKKYPCCRSGVRLGNCRILSCRIHPLRREMPTRFLRSFVVVLHMHDGDFPYPALVATSINSERAIDVVAMTFSQSQTLATSWRVSLVITLLT